MKRLFFLLLIVVGSAFAAGQESWGGPIVIELDGKGFDSAFTDVQHGVTFDFFHFGEPVEMAWTEPGRNIGFLVLNRHGNEALKTDEHENALLFFKIRDGWKQRAASGGTPDADPAIFHVASSREMFGLLTNQPLSREEAAVEMAKSPPEPYYSNGFHALSVFDRKEMGGNGDGLIDANDLVFSHLRVWVDTAHNGRSEDGKMYTLPELGIKYISLDHTTTNQIDGHGNHIRHVGKIGMVDNTRSPLAIYDVNFCMIRNHSGSQ
ncbi:MAG: hypothetical protein WBM04_05260 [Candidatus Korobacteraceae bacterium]